VVEALNFGLLIFVGILGTIILAKGLTKKILIGFIAGFFYFLRLVNIKQTRRPFLIDFAFWVVNTIDKLNDVWTPKGRGVGVFVKARK